ncbi:LPXTG cell wall anchor domain-containing protein [Sphingobium sp. H39-3-25]|uniref:LPXTG cell wall anchor domain-containing protein n=1 Tax=Sphingobium arseniciresistens TaxID=3030834 RepID=UPI0023B929A1|nr:LPXTG cell wall anchor domain-containing protein [Sphingobium arseniciresistens]
MKAGHESGAMTTGWRIPAIALALACAIMGNAVAQDSTGAPTQLPPNGGLGTFSLPPSTAPRPTGPEREGPEIDTRLPASTPGSSAAPPSPQTSPVTTPAQNPAASSTSAVVIPPRIQPTVAQPQTTRQRAPSRDAGPNAASPAGNAAEERSLPGTAALPPPGAQQVAPSALPASTPAPAPVGNTTPETSADTGSRWPIWLGAAGVLAGLAAWMLLRRKRRADALIDDNIAEPVPVEPASAPADMMARPAPPAPAVTAPPVARPFGSASPASTFRPEKVEPASVPAMAAPMKSGQIEIALTPTGARATLMGWTVGYRLTLRNRSALAIEDARIAMAMTNADAAQPAHLAAFFAAPVGAPVHRLAQLAPGETQDITGELRIGHHELKPLEVAGHALLIPVIAVAVEHAAGRDGAAFVIGQEGASQQDRMAPFRLDQGPRHYRGIGSRPVVLSEPQPA